MLSTSIEYRPTRMTVESRTMTALHGVVLGDSTTGDESITPHDTALGPGATALDVLMTVMPHDTARDTSTRWQGTRWCGCTPRARRRTCTLSTAAATPPSTSSRRSTPRRGSFKTCTRTAHGARLPSGSVLVLTSGLGWQRPTDPQSIV
jgi:hypothetical protein